MTNLQYMRDDYLEQMKDEFDPKWLGLYRNQSEFMIRHELESAGALISSHINYEYKPLTVEPDEYNPMVVRRNIRALWESLGHLTAVEAEQEKIWLGLLHSDYLTYHLERMDYLRRKASNPEKSMTSNTIFNNGAKRGLVINHLSLYWWIVYYLYDADHPSNPFHLIDFFVSIPYRGNAVAFFSSNFISKKALALGILDGIKYLVDRERIKLNRKTYSEANKLMNQIGGLRILDTLTREEVRHIIIEQLVDMDGVTTLGDGSMNLYDNLNLLG